MASPKEKARDERRMKREEERELREEEAEKKAHELRLREMDEEYAMRKKQAEEVKLREESAAELCEIVDIILHQCHGHLKAWNMFTSLTTVEHLEELLTSTHNRQKTALMDALKRKQVKIEEPKKGLSAVQAIINCYNADEAPMMSTQDVGAYKVEMAARKGQVEPPEPVKEEDLPLSGTNRALRPGAAAGTSSAAAETENLDMKMSTRTANLPDDPDDSDDSDSSDDGRRKGKREQRRRAADKIRRMLPPDDGASPSHGLSMLVKMYAHESEKYDGCDARGFFGFQTEFIKNMTAAKATSEEAASIMHRTLKGLAKETFLSRFGQRTVLKVEFMLAEMSEIFASKDNRKRAYQIFHHKDFATFRSERGNKDATELEAVQKFYSLLLSAQLTLGDKYLEDFLLRDRLHDVFTAYSSRVAEAFLIQQPRTSHAILEQLRLRSSDTVGVENLPTEAAGAVSDAFAADAVALYLDNRLHASKNYYSGGAAGRGTAGKGQRRGIGKSGQGKTAGHRGPKGGCWVCKSLDHYAHEKHTAKEVEEARAKGKTITAYLATLPAEHASMVAQAHITWAETTGDNDTDEGEEDEADVAEVDTNACITNVDPMTEDETLSFNTETVEGRQDTGFILGLQSSWESDMAAELEDMAIALSADELSFGGIIIDTACTGASVISADEYRRYCRDTGAEYYIDCHATGFVSFGDSRKGTSAGRVRSLGMATICGKIDTFDEVEVKAHVVPNTDTPMLLSMQDLQGLGYELRTGSNTLWARSRVTPQDGEYPRGPHNLHRDERGRAVLSWKYRTQALFTDAELRSLHRSYGHQSADQILEALREAGYDELPKETKQKLADIARSCGPCQRNSSSPRHFSVSMKWRNSRFNHRVLVDVMHTPDGDVVHVYDAGTRLHAARFTTATKNPSAEELWAAIKMCWMDVYVGPPDILQFDQGSSMKSAFIQTACALNGIRYEAVPIEAPWRMGAIERAHAPLRLAYLKLRAELPGVPREEILSMAVKSVNDAVGPAGVSPTMTVFGTATRAFPALSKEHSVVHTDRVRAMQLARLRVQRWHAEQGVKRALAEKGPHPGETALAVGEDVLVHRLGRGWTGPLQVINLTPADVEVRDDKGRSAWFERSHVKKWVSDSPAPSPPDIIAGHAEKDAIPELDYVNDQVLGRSDVLFTVPDPSSLSELCSDVLETKVFSPSAENAVRFRNSRTAELEGLLESGVFTTMPRSDAVAAGARIFRTRFVDSVKGYGTPQATDKSRLVLCGFNDREAKELLTKAPTVSKTSVRLLLSVAASCPGHAVKLRDISQAYTRSETKVQRLVVCEAPLELGLPKDTVLELLRPLYGLAEAGLHWYMTYQKFHKEDLRMSPTRLDTCLLSKSSSGDQPAPEGLVALQVDDSAIAGTASFLALEEEKVQRFPCKPGVIIQDGAEACLFNGAEVSMTEGTYQLSNFGRCADLPQPDFGDFISARALAAYVCLWSKPRLLGRVQLLASKAASPSSGDLKELRSIFHALKEDKECLRFRALDLSSVRLVCYSDAGFASHEDDLRSQLGFVIAMVDDAGRANVVAYASRKCRRVTRSVLASELLALVEGYDMAASLSTQLQEILNRDVPVWCVIDSRTLFNIVNRLGNVTERRLMVDVADLRDEFLCEKLHLFWVPSIENCADPLTKKKGAYSALDALLAGKFSLNPHAWIEHMGRSNDSEDRETPLMP